MIPRDIKQQIDNYIDEGVPPCEFLQAVLVNDLRGSIIAADETNRYDLYDIVVYLENYVPNMSWGNLERIERWLELHRDNPAFIKDVIAYDSLRRKEYYDTAQG